MNETTLALLAILLCGVMIGMIAGMVIFSSYDTDQMKDYDLYNCIWNNAQSNSFTSSPYLIQKIQDECICFRNHNYTNLLEADC